MKALITAFVATFFMMTAGAGVLAVADTQDGGLISLTDEGQDVCEPVAAAVGLDQPFFLASLLDGQGDKEDGCWTLLPDGNVGIAWGSGEKVGYPAEAFRVPVEK